MRQDVVLLVNLERLERDRGSYRMPAIREAVAKDPDLFRLFHQRVIDRFGNHDRADRQITGRKRFGAGDHIGL